jgi:hypothetical protein
MRYHARIAGCFAGILALALVVPGRAQVDEPQGSQRTYVRGFRLHVVDLSVAETWIWELCERLRAENACRVVEAIEGDEPRLAIEGTDRVHAEVARLLAQRDSATPATRSFQVVLLQATKTGRTMDPALGERSLAALRDVGDYLPFTGFRVLDTAILTTTRNGETRLTGPDGLEYEVGLSFRDTHTVEGPVIEVLQLRVRGEVVHESEPPARPGDAEANQRPQPRHKSVENLLSTSLSMRPGETAVVGTSRLDGGDEALVVLLTALEGRAGEG